MGIPVPKSQAYDQARNTVEGICTELGQKYGLVISTTKIEPYTPTDTISLRPPQDGPLYIRDSDPYFQALLDLEHTYDPNTETLGGIEQATLTIIPSFISKRDEDFMKELRDKFREHDIRLELLRIR